jgi:transcriptional regulator with XRE-family HTH domain
MPRRKLHNYLRTYRKRFGLSQKETAYLLGCTKAAKVSRYECFARLPSLKTALAYEAIFGVPVAELFAGFYQEIEKETSRRARRVAHKKKKAKSTPTNERKANLLRAIAITPDILKENS